MDYTNLINCELNEQGTMFCTESNLLIGQTILRRAENQRTETGQILYLALQHGFYHSLDIGLTQFAAILFGGIIEMRQLCTRTCTEELYSRDIWYTKG